MKFWIGIADQQWFEHLVNLRPDVVNFWQPSALTFQAIELDAPFLFKLHSPLNCVWCHSPEGNYPAPQVMHMPRRRAALAMLLRPKRWPLT
jgi:hypothetical protein